MSFQPLLSRACHNAYHAYARLCGLVGKRSRFEYTTHLEQCCRQLIQDQEYPTDLLLVNLIRIRQIAIKVNDVSWEPIEVTNTSPFRKFHSIAVASIRNELDTFMQQLPEHLKWNRKSPTLVMGSHR